jgi:type IV secretory pathway TrbD component
LRSALLAVINLLAALMLLALSTAFYPDSPLISVALLLAAIDQFLDAYQAVTGRNPYPRWLFGFDIAMDIYQILLGVAAVLLGLSYMSWLASPVYPILFVLVGVALASSSVIEIARMDPEIYGLVRSHEARPKRRRVLR